MANFDIAYNIVIGHEGGYQDNPNDINGNYNSLGQLVGSNFGISAPVYESFLSYPPSKSDMQNMSIQTAKSIYRTRFWDDIKGDLINNQQVANIFFDGRVNHGRTGVKIMQRILGVTDDGVVGPVTLKAINESNPSWLFNQYKLNREAFYNYLANVNPGFSVFLIGWLNRINSFNYVATGGSILGAILLFILITRQ